MSFAQTIQYIYLLILIYKKKEHDIFSVFSCIILTRDKIEEKKIVKTRIKTKFYHLFYSIIFYLFVNVNIYFTTIKISKKNK